MPSYLTDMMHRIAAMQKEALDPITGTWVDAVPYWPYQQEAFPYFTNRLAGPTYDDQGEDIAYAPYRVLMRLVVAHITEGYHGESSGKVYEYIPEVEGYFFHHPMLTTDNPPYTDEPDYLLQEARLLSHTGVVAFQNAGVMSTQLGVEFTLETPFIRKRYPGL